MRSWDGRKVKLQYVFTANTGPACGRRRGHGHGHVYGTLIYFYEHTEYHRRCDYRYGPEWPLRLTGNLAWTCCMSVLRSQADADALESEAHSYINLILVLVLP